MSSVNNMAAPRLLLCCLCIFFRPGFTRAASARTRGDVLIGGLFSIHTRTTSNLQCGHAINEQVGIHRLEAMLYAVDKVNNDSSLLPGITLGVDLRDDCETENRALEECLHFIPGALHDQHSSCEQMSSSQNPPLAAVVGPSYSNVAVQVASLLRLFRVPQVSYAATSSELSDKDRFEYFVRTVPPDTFQVRAMIDIIRHMNWTAAFAVYSQGSYGEGAMASFASGASQLVCIPYRQLLDPGMTKVDYDELLDRFKREPNVPVVVMFCNSNDLRSVLLAAKRAKVRGVGRDWVWLASDFWGTRYRHLEGLEDVAEGAVTMELQTFKGQLMPFYSHLSSLSPLNNTRNPWFKEFWESHFNCSLNDNMSFVSAREGRCRIDNSLSLLARFDAKVPFVIDAVLSIAHALDEMHRNVCNRQPGLCDRMKPLDSHLLLSYIRNASFNGTTGLVRFNADGDSPGRYDIFTFKGKKYRRIGTWADEELKMTPNPSTSGILSGCGDTCQLGAIRRRREADCCWICARCAANEFLVDEYTCKPCEQGQKPNATYSGCESLPNKYLSVAWVVVIAVCSTLGVIVTLFICGVFVRYNDTALIKASGRELSFLLLAAIGLCYCVALILVSRPGPVVCALQRLGIGTCFCMCYATILVRTNRIARIFHYDGVTTPSFISPRSQLLIAAVIIAPELAVACTELAVRPPDRVLSYEYKNYNLMRCNINTVTLVVVFSYNAVLIVLCTIYAFKTRKTPLNFNEARFIGFCMYTTCVIWISFLPVYYVPVYYGIGGGYEALALSISSVLSATTILVFIFIPKVYIVLFKPEKNLRGNSRPHSRTKSLDFFDASFRSGKLKGSPSKTSEQAQAKPQKHQNERKPSPRKIRTSASQALETSEQAQAKPQRHQNKHKPSPRDIRAITSQAPETSERAQAKPQKHQNERKPSPRNIRTSTSQAPETSEQAQAKPQKDTPV